MNKKPVLFLAVVICLYSCSSLKPLGFSSNTSLNQTTQPVQQNIGQEKSSDVKFLNNISVVPQNSSASNNELQPTAIKRGPNATLTTSKEVEFNSPNLNNTESGTAIQMKYAALLNTDVSQVQNKKLFEYIDEWYGTRYCMGGTSKSCIDCSAFVQSLVGAIYGITVPRTAVTQYKASKRISTTELKEGDLLFFHTRRNHGLVTHVGIYLQNNKFVHASSSGGVTISDMYEPYYVQHLIAAGRIIE
jgi:lipoprotein Spr